MSAFSIATYDALIQKIEHLVQSIVNAVNRFISAVESAASSIPIIGGLIGDGAKWLLDKLRNLVEEGLNKVEEYLKPAMVPPTMWNDGQTWSQIGKACGNTASTLSGINAQNGFEWKGIAGGKYQDGVQDQPTAANTLSTWSATIMDACDSIATGGMVFYAAIAAALVTFLAAAIAAGTGDVPALIVAIVAMIASLGVALVSFYFGVESGVRSLNSVTWNNDAFPGGSWPQATAQTITT
jgi:hypothetical protein